MEEISVLLTEKVRQREEYKSAKNIMLFYPTKYEVNLLGLLSDEKKFYFPRVAGNDLQVCPYEPGEKLKKSGFNISEPCSEPVNSKMLDLIIVPALMVDKHGYRLGYGGGFYDRFLSSNNGIVTLCAIPKSLYVDELPHEKFDICIDIVITEK